MVSLSALGALPTSVSAAPLTGWSVLSGEGWDQVVDLQTMLLQRSAQGVATAVSDRVNGGPGAWRCVVEPSLGAQACGIWFQATKDLSAGLRAELGAPGTVGFALKDAQGQILWQDVWAPWAPYQAYVIEGIVEGDRARVQLLAYDRKTLISQSDFVALPEGATAAEGHLAVYTENAVARFWGADRTEEPLAALTEDAPNRRRLAEGPNPEWALFGTGNWAWTDASRTRIRQSAMAERAWAADKASRATRSQWQTWVRVSPGAGGAGIAFPTDGGANGGMMAWLGGNFGAGCLMLYTNSGPTGIGEALWSSPQDMWHYDEDLLIRAEAKDTQVRIQLIAADGTTVITESPWVAVPADRIGHEGIMAFHTWKGNAEFWGFREEAGAAGPAGPTASALGEGWLQAGGAWEWANDARSALKQSGADEASSCVNTTIRAARATWQCRVKIAGADGGAGLLAQVSPVLDQGFACLILPGKAEMVDFGQKRSLWTADGLRWEAGAEYIVQAVVQTDRVRMRVVAADGQTVIAESPDVYIPDTNNDRIGHLGFTCRGGAAEFSDWGVR